MKTTKDAIKWLENIRDDAVATLDHIRLWEPDVNTMLYRSRKEKAEIALRALKHTQWIPVQERLPREPEEGLTDIEDLQEYIVMIAGAEKSTCLQYAGNGEWIREGKFYSVVAWMPLPEPYKAEQEADYENTTSQ